MKFLFLIILIIKFIKGFQIIIDYKSNIEYSNFECGGSIDLKELNTTIYPSCNSIEDASIRSKQIQLLNENINLNNYNLTFLIKNTQDEPIQDKYSFGVLDNFKQINIISVDNELKEIKPINEEQYQIIQYNSSYRLFSPNNFSDSTLYKPFLKLNQTSQKITSKETNFKIQGFKFLNFIYNSNTLIYGPIIDFYNFTGGIEISNCQIENSNLFSYSQLPTLTYPKYIILNNTIFNNNYDTCIQARINLIENCQFNNYTTIEFGLLLLKGIVKLNNCIFQNNYIPNNYLIYSYDNENININQFKNSIISNNTIKGLFLGGDDELLYSYFNIQFSNFQIINNIITNNYLFFLQYNDISSILSLSNITINNQNSLDNNNNGLIKILDNLGSMYINIYQLNSNLNLNSEKIFQISDNIKVSIENSTIKNWDGIIPNDNRNESSSYDEITPDYIDNNNKNNNDDIIIKSVIPITIFITFALMVILLSFLNRKKLFYSKNVLNVPPSQRTTYNDDAVVDNITVNSSPTTISFLSNE